MFRPTTLATLSVLALSGCIATPASAQYLYGSLHDYSGPHHDHGHRGYYDSHHRYFDGHEDYHGYGHIAYPDTVLSRHHAIPVYAETTFPYGNDAINSRPIGCPLQRSRTLPSRLTDEYQHGFGLESPRRNHSHDRNSHSGHSHEGHSHDGHSHVPQIPSRDVAPSDRNYLAPPSLPRDSARELQPRQDFHREEPQRDDSIRMDNSPPPTVGTRNSSGTSESTGPRHFNTPPPPTL